MANANCSACIPLFMLVYTSKLLIYLPLPSQMLLKQIVDSTDSWVLKTSDCLP